MPDIIYEKRGRIAYVTINRPEAMNALGPAQNIDMIQAWCDFRDDPEVWVAILTGAGDKAFCAGADLKNYTPALAERAPYDLRQDANRTGFGGITRRQQRRNAGPGRRKIADKGGVADDLEAAVGDFCHGVTARRTELSSLTSFIHRAR